MKKRVLSIAIACIMVISLFSASMVANAAVYAETSYEAENATLHGVSIGKDHAGYTGSGFVDHFDSLGDCVDFTINISEAGDYSMIFRYANAGGYYASANVYFDGEFEATAVFPSLSGWDTWGTAEVGNYLDAGKHTVRIEYNNHAINIDSLSVEVKHESTRSLYLSNMKNMMAIWKAGQLCSDDSDIQSTRIDELRLSNDWTFNQIYDYTGFFRDETGKKNYSEGQNFESEGYFDENGILRTNYLRYNDNYPSGIEFSRDYTAVPDHQVIVTRYVVKNTSSSEKTVNVLDMLNPANAGQFNSTVSFHKSQNAFVIDRSSANLPYMALGAFSEPTSFQAGNDANSSVTQNTCSPWYSFNNDGTLHNNTEVTAQSVSAGLMQTLHIRAGEEASVFFLYCN